MKVEEFNVSITQFIQNIQSKSDLISIITNLELLLIERLDFHLTIHNFYRPFEGFLLDIKVKYRIYVVFFIKSGLFKAHCPDIKNSDMLRQSAFEFLDKILNTDAILLYPPSQIALTALVYSSSKNKIEYIDNYCQSVLLSELNKDEVKHMLTIIKSNFIFCFCYLLV
jgi:cyclin H